MVKYPPGRRGKTARSYSRLTREAARLLGRQVRLGRKERGWSEIELAERAGVSRATVQKIEKGELSVAIGLVFEAAALVGVPLFDESAAALAPRLARVEDRLALLPARVRKPRTVVDDDF